MNAGAGSSAGAAVSAGACGAGAAPCAAGGAGGLSSASADNGSATRAAMTVKARRLRRRLAPRPIAQSIAPPPITSSGREPLYSRAGQGIKIEVGAAPGACAAGVQRDLPWPMAPADRAAIGWPWPLLAGSTLVLGGVCSCSSQIGGWRARRSAIRRVFRCSASAALRLILARGRWRGRRRLRRRLSPCSRFWSRCGLRACRRRPI